MEQIEGVISLKDNVSSVLSTIQGNMSRFSQTMATMRQETSVFENIKLSQKTVTVDFSQIRAAQENYSKLSQAQNISLGVEVDASAVETMRASFSAMQSQHFSMTVTETGIDATIKKLGALKDGADEAKTSMSAFEQISKATGGMKTAATSLGSLIDNTKKAAVSFRDMNSPVEGAVAVFSALDDAMNVGNGITQTISSFKSMGSALGLVKTATTGATTAQLGLNAAQSASPWGWVGLAISGVVAGVSLLQQHIEEINRPLTETREELGNIGDAYESSMNAAQESFEEQTRGVDSMRKAVFDFDMLMRSGASNRKIDLAAQDLLKKFPELEDAIEKVNGKWLIQKDRVYAVIEAMSKQIQVELAAEEWKSAQQQQRDSKKTLESAKEKLDLSIADDEDGYEKFQAKIEAADGGKVTAYYEAMAKNKRIEDDETASFDEKLAASGAVLKAFSDAFGDDALYDPNMMKWLPKEQAVYEAQQAVDKASTDVGTASTNYENAYQEQLDSSTKHYSAGEELRNILQPAQDEVSPLIEAEKDIEEGNLGVAYERMGASETDIKKYRDSGNETQAALDAVNQSIFEGSKTQLIAASDKADEILALYGDELTTEERKGLEEFSSTVKDAINGTSETAGESMAKAVEWMKTFELPVAVKVWIENGGAQVKQVTSEEEEDGEQEESSTKGYAAAAGTSYSPGGWTRVNEQGDELIELPTGAKVYPMQETGRQLQEISSGGGTTVNFYLGGVTIREDADINRIAAEFVERLERQRMIMV